MSASSLGSRQLALQGPARGLWDCERLVSRINDQGRFALQCTASAIRAAGPGARSRFRSKDDCSAQVCR